MAAGIVPTALDINSRASTVAIEAWNALDQAHDWYLFFNDANHNDAFFNALGITGSKSDSATDLGKLFVAAADLGGPAGLWGTAHNLSHPSANNDFFFTAYRLTGMNWTGSAQ